MPAKSKTATKRLAAAALPQPKAMKRTKAPKEDIDDEPDGEDDSEPLTADAIEKCGLNQKIDLLRKSKLDHANFTSGLGPKTAQVCWKRFEFGRCKKTEA